MIRLFRRPTRAVSHEKVGTGGGVQPSRPRGPRETAAPHRFHKSALRIGEALGSEV